MASSRARTSDIKLIVSATVAVVLAGLFIIDLAILAPSTSGIGYLLVFTGIPIYFIWRRRSI